MSNQEEAFEKLARLKVGALFMEMGTGKTKVALDLIVSKKEKIELAIWVCPFSLKNEIENERKKWHPDLQLEVVGCESIGSSDRIFLELFGKMQNNRCFMVVDESLKIKNKEAKRTERILQLGKLAEYRLILNGTPLSKNVLDLWTQMQFLSPKILNMSYLEFKNNYCEYYVRGSLKGTVKKQHNIEHLIALIEPYIFDCKLDLKAKKRYHDISYSMNEQEKNEYQELKESYLSTIADMSQIDFFSFSNLLQRQYCRAAEKRKELDKLLQEIPEKVLVFVKYLESIPKDALKITGEMKMAERAEAINCFKASEKVLYTTYGCGAYGLNLQFCKNIIFLEHVFDYAQREQAEARIYRLGQEDDVDYYNLWCSTGLEKLIQASQQKKGNLLDEVKKEIERQGVMEWLNTI